MSVNDELRNDVKLHTQYLRLGIFRRSRVPVRSTSQEQESSLSVVGVSLSLKGYTGKSNAYRIHTHDHTIRVVTILDCSRDTSNSSASPCANDNSIYLPSRWP